MRAGKFGEPWEQRYCVVDHDGRSRGHTGAVIPHTVWDARGLQGSMVAEVCGGENLANGRSARIVACVNACSGIEDPAVVPDLVAFVQDFFGYYESVSDPYPHGYDEARALLARIGGEA